MRNALPDYRPTKPEMAVFVSGITSMGLEILAVRIVAPQFGSHIYTVGGILTVFLAALSLGYWQGGKRAALATNREMSWIMLGTAVYVAVVVYGSDFLLAYTSTLAIPPRYASLPAVIVLFGPPTYLLGFISPYAAQLSQKQGIGEASGHVYALGTIGSILGSAATTFVLIPYLSVAQIGLLFGLTLVATALALTLPSLPRNSTVASVVVVLLLVTAAGGGPVAFDHRGDVVHESQTPHQHLEVVDDGDDVRTMYLDGAHHSAMDLEEPDRHVFAYTKYFHLPMLMVDDPAEVDDVLFIGGGGYTGPQDFEDRYDVDVDVVEIDPEVTEAAEDYFGLEHGETMTSHAEDGRQFLQGADDEYDVIVLDAYKQDQVPFHMTTEEFMEVTADRLSDDGVLLANIVSAPSGSASEFYRAEYATMEAAFPEVYSFRTSDENSVQNIQLVATKDGEALSQDDLEARNTERDLGVDLSDEIDHYMTDPETDDVPVLRDDRAPVDSLLDPMLGQRYVIEETESSEPTTANPAVVAGAR
ncbi:fused MFS/spermidine synthase [Natronococcus sp. A-GB7]|uniref:spermidine synthase n=1 Tax=Natronococcus sp. A-GB7 TaxID=3037649 RepID=UPI0024201534|nr:fused MFS/spermidine synthase [Natronococcus sp. A-GB7]MDG5818451.1 fused MFS/spermidine synthase [Natronococcus sp. A-GB7]